VHVVFSIEASVCISELLGALKGGSSDDINEEDKRISLQWQRGYGVVSFGRKNLPWVLDYVARQREHHASGEPYAGEPHVRFGGGRGRELNRLLLPLSLFV